jgi:N utilization substance protein B
MKNNKQQWIKRVDLFRYFYTLLIKPIAINDIVVNAKNENEFNDEQLAQIDYFARHQDDLKKIILANLSPNWTYERVKPILKAIIICAYCESQILNTPKKILIDQAIVNAKKYSNENDYKFINAILDKIIIEHE